jgi:hypothetical protein
VSILRISASAKKVLFQMTKFLLTHTQQLCKAIRFLSYLMFQP